MWLIMITISMSIDKFQHDNDAIQEADHHPDTRHVITRDVLMLLMTIMMAVFPPPVDK